MATVETSHHATSGSFLENSVLISYLSLFVFLDSITVKLLTSLAARFVAFHAKIIISSGFAGHYSKNLLSRPRNHSIDCDSGEP
jgi:hypothetical protein